MAKRKVEEINSGSMADVAFLLLIFFLVTTTMEVDAGISRNLPLKFIPPDGWTPPPVHDRDVLIIMANNNDELLVEGEPLDIDELEEKVRHFYTANMDGGENDIDMPEWTQVNAQVIAQEMQKLNDLIANGPADQKSIHEGDLKKWEKRKDTFEEIGPYNEISPSSLIQLKNQSMTSYGLYLEIQNILKKVVNELRAEECNKLGWGEYKDLDPKEPADQEKLEMLQVLIPERIIEAKIDR